MTKLLSSALLAAAVAGLTVGSGFAPAQDKKDAKKDTKKDAKEAKGGTIEVSEGKDGKFRFTVRDADGKYLGGNTVGHETKDAAVKAVDALKATLGTAKIEYDTKK